MAVPSSSLSLSGAWRFAADPDAYGQARGWAEPEFDDSRWVAVTVPHTWNVMPDHYSHDGFAWYRRSFTVPVAARHGHLRLRFEAVFYVARVWLNGIYLGEHEGGYTPFEFDVSGLAKPGSENTLAVQVDNRRAMNRLPAVVAPDWSFDWWNYGGIVRDVSLRISSRAFVAHQRITAVPSLVAEDQADTATISARVTVTNTSTEALEGVLMGEAFDEASGAAALSPAPTRPISLPPGESTEVRLNGSFAHPKLWHFDHPHLYRWLASLRTVNGETLHTAEVTFGVRSVELRGARLYLNGEPVRLVGATRHADSPEHGLAEPITVMAADYTDLKTLNVVLSRPVHYPQAEFILDYADRHGILLIPEIPAWQLTAAQMADPHMRQLAQQRLRELVTSHSNHPAVWAWSVGNEIASDTAAGHDFVESMIAFTKSLDSTRPVGFASNRLNTRPWGDATASADFVLMNQYFGTWAGPKAGLDSALDAIHATWPNKAVIISEYGFEPHWGRVKGAPFPEPSQYYAIPSEVPSDSESADLQRRQLIIEQMALFRRKPFIAGAIFWTYQDYRTPTNYMMGVVDAQRNRRGSWQVLREMHAPVLIDTVHIFPMPDGTQRATVSLQARGPIETDMPAYTLRGYRLRWGIASQRGGTVYAGGDLQLPTLAPGTAWSGDFEWKALGGEYVLTLSIIRPSGFTVIERSYDSQDQRLQGTTGR
ncbi:MAG TPA: glycoside hydrolase family 2 TIM barrel-domain containing protein [Candidatus Tectomicrobia bacterium]|nr:glycoside hydrolase family 2 TIM barrel-domain containing protein [Candidatus Tectomicrobia bacterium]